MFSGIILTVILTSTPGQADAPPQTLPPVEGLRAPGSLPSPAEVALPLSTSGCASCNAASNIAQYPAGCTSGTCYGATCNTEPTGPPVKSWTAQTFLIYNLKASPMPALLAGANGFRLNTREDGFDRALGAGVAGQSWFNDAHTIGYGYSAFLLEQKSSISSFASNGNGSPQLVRPFIDTSTGALSNFFVADPGRLRGTLVIENGARLGGGEIYGLKNIYYCPTRCFNLLAGFRYLDLDEYLEIYQQTAGVTPQTFTIAGSPTPGPLNLVDRFRTRNQFYGFEIGGRSEYTHGCLSLAVTSKLGMGNNHQTLDIAGQTTGAPAPTTQGGFLALRSNIGQDKPNRFAILLDLSAEFGVQVSKGSRLFVAYDFIYLNEVIRPGGQVDPVINTRNVPSSANFNTQSGPQSPLPTQGRTDFNATGVRIGYQVQF